MSRRPGVLPRFTFSSALVTIIVIVVIALVAFFAGKLSAPRSTRQTATAQDAAPITNAEQKLNKSFDVSVKNDKGVEITKIKYNLENAVLQNQIIIRGTRATAIQGKTFLIINFNLNNTSNKYIQLNSRDYVRLVGANGEMIAPDIHNDPIQIQPISTKESRLGFPVDATTKKFTLSVGEIDGKKTQVTINF